MPPAKSRQLEQPPRSSTIANGLSEYHARSTTPKGSRTDAVRWLFGPEDSELGTFPCYVSGSFLCSQSFQQKMGIAYPHRRSGPRVVADQDQVALLKQGVS